MVSDCQAAITELERMRERVRTLRSVHCEPKSNENPRCHALSMVVSNLTRAIDDMQSDS